MVTFYISYTKKILTISIIFLFGCSNKISTDQKSDCLNIADYLEMIATPTNTNISIGDTMNLQVRFINKTTDTVSFYPKGVLILATPTEGFHSDSKFISKVQDWRYLESVPSKGEFRMVCSILVDSVFFKRGIKPLVLGYLVKKGDDSNRKHNTVCGSLESSEFKVHISQ